MLSWFRRMLAREKPAPVELTTNPFVMPMRPPASPGVVKSPATVGDYPTEWQHAIKHVLVAEGGYVDHPNDPGGCTNMGVTLATLRTWRGDQSVSCSHVLMLDEQEAREIYRALYWNTVQGDALAAGVSLVVFDFAVNAGVRRAALALQATAGMDKEHWDGVIGPKTLAAVASRDPVALVTAYSARRRSYYRALKNFPIFGNGWLNRTDHMQHLALQRIRDVKVRAGA